MLTTVADSGEGQPLPFLMTIRILKEMKTWYKKHYFYTKFFLKSAEGHSPFLRPHLIPFHPLFQTCGSATG